MKKGEVTKSLAVKAEQIDGGDNGLKRLRLKFAAFGNVDNDGDILVKGCFAKSIQERGPDSPTNRKIAFLAQHNTYWVIGKILKMWEQEDGAYIDVEFSDFDAVPMAKQLYSQLVTGHINQLSFGGNYVAGKLERLDDDTYLIKEIALREVSVVTFGANENTQFVEALKSMSFTDEQKKELREHLAEPQDALTKDCQENILELLLKTF